MTLQISQGANDLIVACEVGSRAQYEKKYRRPEWPGGRSGVTVGIGYDLGYATAAKVKKDWGDLLDGRMVDAMLSCVGISGDAARTKTAAVRSAIDIGWNDAIKVYSETDIPEWVARVCKTIPGADKLPPDCLGALTSLAYNRGVGCFTLNGDRYTEGRAIRAHILAGDLGLVDDEIRKMSRLWPGPNERGLPIRRNKEAALWNAGLLAKGFDVPASKPAAEKMIVKEVPEPLVPPRKPGGTAEGTAGGGTSVIVGAEMTRQGVDPVTVAIVVGIGIVITVGAVAYLRHLRSQPVLARAKG